MADILDNEEDAYNGREVDRNAFISGIDTLEVDNIIATRVEKVRKYYLYRVDFCPERSFNVR